MHGPAITCKVSLAGPPCLRAAFQTRGAPHFVSRARVLPAVPSAARPCRCRRPPLHASAQEPGAQAAPEQSQMSVELMKSMEASITEALNAEKVKVQDAYGDGRHVSIEVVSAEFEGQTSVKRQRLVYKAIWQELQETVHAVDSMVTKTPAEVAS